VQATFKADFSAGNNLTITNPLPVIPKTIKAVQIGSAAAANDFVFDQAASTDISLVFHATANTFLVTIDTTPIGDVETFLGV